MANGIGIINGFDVSSKSPIDKRYGIYTGSTVSNCLQLVTNSGNTSTYIPPNYRYEGLTIGVKVGTLDVVEYWFNGGIADNNLVIKTQDLTVYYPNTGGTVSGYVTADGFKTPSGTSSQYLMADGSVSTDVDNYLPLSGGTLTGNLTGTTINGNNYYVINNGTPVPLVDLYTSIAMSIAL